MVAIFSRTFFLSSNSLISTASLVLLLYATTLSRFLLLFVCHEVISPWSKQILPFGVYSEPRIFQYYYSASETIGSRYVSLRFFGWRLGLHSLLMSQVAYILRRFHWGAVGKDGGSHLRAGETVVQTKL